ncbi:MAG: YihY/virulence factor BrkB family protein [Bacteroidota bacterium]
MRKLINKAKRLWRRSMVFLRRVKLPGFEGLSLYDVLRFFYTGLTDSKFTLMSAAMAYNFFISLFSTLFLIFLFIPRIPIAELESKIIEMISNIVPNQGITAVEKAVNAYLTQTNSDTWLVILMILLSIWGAIRGVLAMMKAFTKNEETFKNRGFFELYGTALLIFMTLGVLVIVSAALLIVGREFLDWMWESGFLSENINLFLLQTLRYLLTLLTIFLAISTIYYLGPATQKRWNFFSPGAITAGVLILFAMIGLDFFVQRFSDSTFNAIYGSISTIILLIVWFNYLSIMLLIGFELNAAIDLAALHASPTKLPDPVPEPELEMAESGSSSDKT